MALARISEPRESWPDEYTAIAARLRAALGRLALRIDHIGSTSVPGLAAKDVIDVQVTVAGIPAPGFNEAMTAAGFRGRGEWLDHTPPGMEGTPPAQWAKLYFDEPAGEREMHIHVRAAGRLNQRYALLFRDYLRASPRAAAVYAHFKRRLAGLGIETAVYADIKNPVCDAIMIAAAGWAAEVGWEPD